MTEEKKNRYLDLIEEFPLVFRLNAENKARAERGEEQPKRPFHSIEAFGVECGQGWYDLIRECVVSINAELLAKPEIQPGFTVVQIKEKFGTLRFYTSGVNEAISEAITVASRKSAVTCEVCGQPGELVGPGWLSTVCEAHMQPDDVKYSEMSDDDDEEDGSGD